MESPSSKSSEPDRRDPTAASRPGGWRGRLIIAKGDRWVLVAFLAAVALTALLEGWLGRSPLGPDGRFGWWDGNIWSSENSQRVADAYSFTHVVHGILFFALLYLAARNLPLPYRFTL